MSESTAQRDVELLRRYEPVLRMTHGEKFLPITAADYVRHCSLWVQRPDEAPHRLVLRGELDLETLGQPRSDDFGSVHFLKFVNPLNLAELARLRLQRGFKPARPEERFQTSVGRLARVGYYARLIDAGFSLSLLLRGRVPGDTAAAAIVAREETYPNWGNPDEFRYHGRVVHQGRWITLQYWILYPYNNWRSGFYGANDHEADWEMICIYLARNNGDEPRPVWAAYATHDAQGDMLRRRWDDPGLELIDDCHPVVYVGAGSHAGYFEPGEYLTEIEMALFAPLVKLRDNLQKTWKELRGKKVRNYLDDEPLFPVPFVDYARGDGPSIGRGQAYSWGEPILIDPAPDWVLHYRGLWGLYAEDPVSGENAPAGPMYNRDGSVRRAWYDPVGWAGLEKVVPPDEALDEVERRIAQLRDERKKINKRIDRLGRELSTLGIETRAMQSQPHLAELYRAHRKEIKKLSAKLDKAHSQLAEDEALIDALTRYADKLSRGYRPDPGSHLGRVQRPLKKQNLRLARIMEVWSAASIGLMLLVLVGLRLFAREFFFLGIAGIGLVIAFVEAGTRKRLVPLIHTISILLGVLAGIVLVYQYFWPILEGLLIAAGLYLMIQNLRELGSE